MSLETALELKDGRLYWKEGNYKGRAVGRPRGDGYYIFRYQKKTWLYHRVLFFMVHGYWPKQVDHIDGNPSNNTIDNLRESDARRNNQNLAAPRSHNRCSSLGVSIRTRQGRLRYRAKIVVDGKAIELGEYKTEEEASASYQQAKVKYHVPVGVRPK